MTWPAVFAQPQTTVVNCSNKNRLYFNATQVESCQRLLHVLCAFSLRSEYGICHDYFTVLCLFLVLLLLLSIFGPEREKLTEDLRKESDDEPEYLLYVQHSPSIMQQIVSFSSIFTFNTKCFGPIWPSSNKLRGFIPQSELYRPSDRRLSAKLVPTLADRRCRVVSATHPHGR
jgi:hypothetical protein